MDWAWTKLLVGLGQVKLNGLTHVGCGFCKSGRDSRVDPLWVQVGVTRPILEEVQI